MAHQIRVPVQLIIEQGAVSQLPKTPVYQWLEEKRVFLFCGKNNTLRLAEMIRDIIRPQAKSIQIIPCKDNTLDTINQLERKVLEDTPDYILGIGGGKALDVSKVVGTRCNVPVILIPTAASSDAICSPVAVIKMMDRSTSIGVRMPMAVIIDLDILASCPPRLVSAGIGDLLSNKTALFDWQLAHRAGKEEMVTFAALMAGNAVESFMNILNRENVSRSQLLKATAESLIMSGIAMAVAGSSRPCSGSEHLISHALDYHCGAKALHGEQVAIGILISQYLQGKRDEVEPLYPYYEKLGLPTHYEDIGYTKEEMIRAIRMAPSMRNRYTILDEYNLTDKQIGHILDEVFPVKSKNRYYSIGLSAK